MGKHFLWDPVEDNIIEEFDDAGATIADYTTEPYHYGDLISQHRDGQSSFYHYDGQGSTTSLTDSAANVTDTYAYSGFGELTVQSGSTDSPFRFIGRQGYYWDWHKGQCIIRRRDLVSVHGRWLSTDPAHSTMPLSSYVYVLNRPTLSLDASGLSISEPDLGDGPFCFNAGSDLSKPQCQKQGLRPYGELCYTGRDYTYCLRKLRTLAFLGAIVRPCTSLLVRNFLDSSKTIDPYCPSECLNAIKYSTWASTMTSSLLDKALSWPLACGTQGSGSSSRTFGGPCEDPFVNVNTDLALSIGAVDAASLSMKVEYWCGDTRCEGCCGCSVATKISYTITDLYDFISTVNSRAVPYDAPWCAAIIENHNKKINSGGFFTSEVGRPFTTSCKGIWNRIGFASCPKSAADLRTEIAVETEPSPPFPFGGAAY